MPAPYLLVLLSSAAVIGPAGLPSGFEPLSFSRVPKATAYSWDPASGALHAKAEGSASGLIARVEAPATARVLRWRWKVAGPVPGGDESRKSGDDYAARVYVAFKYDPARVGGATRIKYALARRLLGRTPPGAAINYIWANRLPKDADAPNPYSERVRMVAVRSGGEEAGRWLDEERDVRADYRRLFGGEPPPVEGIAVMTDADDTGASAEAWYAALSLGER